MSADEILAAARQYRQSLAKQHRKPSWTDYTRFKSWLYQNGHYGKEAALATALGL